MCESSIVRVDGTYTLNANFDLGNEPVFRTVQPCCVVWKPWLGSPITTRSGSGYSVSAASYCQNVGSAIGLSGVSVPWQISVRANCTQHQIGIRIGSVSG